MALRLLNLADVVSVNSSGDMKESLKHIIKSQTMFDADFALEALSLEWKYGHFKDAWLIIWKESGCPGVKVDEYNEWPPVVLADAPSWQQ